MERCVALILSLIVCLLAHVHFCTGFQCPFCSYYYSQDDPNADTACIYQPEIYTGNQLITCRDRCVVQEIYSTRLNKVVAYWRSCDKETDTGFCRVEQDRLICLYRCLGSGCNNWATGQLHSVYGNIGPPGNGDQGHIGEFKVVGMALVLLYFLL